MSARFMKIVQSPVCTWPREARASAALPFTSHMYAILCFAAAS